MYDLTIITINYNNSIGLKETIESVINQSFVNFEYVVIDGGSNDGSKDVISEYSEKINVSIIEPDNGIYNAMNKGVLNSNGKYVLFLNSGDTFYSNDAILSFKEYLKTDTFDIVYGNLSVIDEEKKWIKKYPSHLTLEYFINDTLPFPCAIINKKLIIDMGMFDENLKIVSDWKFFLQAICKSNKKYNYIPFTIVNFKLDGISSNNSELVKTEREKVLKDEFSFIIEDYIECLSFRDKLNNLKKSKKFRFLQKLNFFNGI